MKKLYKLLIVMALVCSSLISNAQNDGVTFTLLPQMPYSNYYNPGIRVPYKGVVGVGFSNINVSVFNSSIIYKNLYTFNDNGEEVIDGEGLINSLEEQDNFFNFNMSLDILNVGFRVNKLFFNLDWRTRVNTEFQYSKDFVGFFVLGNGHYLGDDNPCDFNVGADATAFMEFGLGVQYDVNDKLTIGVRPKLLNGLANITVTNEQTKIYTDPDTYSISADVNLDIKAASVFKTDFNRISDIVNVMDSLGVGSMFDAKNNYGFGIDFGASYKINDHWGVAAGVYDLGYIKWKDSKVKKTNKEDVTLNSAVFNNIEDLTTMKLDYNDMLKKIVDNVWGDDSLTAGEDYKTSLKTRILLQGYYEYNPMLRITAIGQLYSVRGEMKPSLTLAYSGLFLNHFNLSLSYTMSQYTGQAVGLGLGGHFGPFNCYFVADNILALTKVTAPTVEFATAYKTAGVRMGIVWTIGKYNQ